MGCDVRDFDVDCLLSRKREGEKKEGVGPLDPRQK